MFVVVADSYKIHFLRYIFGHLKKKLVTGQYLDTKQGLELGTPEAQRHYMSVHCPWGCAYSCNLRLGNI